MINEIHSDLIRGHIDTIILKILFEGDRYGYEICRDIESKCNGQYSLKQPTLYSCLNRLEKKGFISSYWGGTNTKGGRRKYYTLTEQGKDLFIKNKTEWEYSRSVINRLISDRDFNIEALPPIEESLTYAKKANNSIEKKLEEIVKTDKEEEEEEEKEEKNEVAVTTVTDTATAVNTDDLDILLTSEFEQKMLKNLQERQDEEIRENLEGFGLSMPKPNGSSYAQFLEKQEYEVCYVKPRPSFSNYNDNFVDDREEVESEQADSESELPPFIEDYEDEDKIVQKIISDYRRPRYEQKQQVVSPPSEEELARDYINKEYKNLIAKIFGQKSYASPASIVPDTSFEIKKSSYQRVAQPQQREATKVTQKKPQNQTDLQYRQHSKKISEQYYNAFYYYSAKLRISHYGILFAIMLIEIATAFLTIKFQMGITQKDEWRYYISSVLLATLFPIVAGVLYLREPEAKQRYNFSLKNSLFLRLMVMIYVIMGTVLLNFLIFNRTADDPSTYMVSLVMPILMSINIPISAIIFAMRYHSKKYSA